MRRGMAKSAGGRQAGRPVRGTGGYRCDDAKGGAELCVLRAGRYAGHGGGSVESRERDDDVKLNVGSGQAMSRPVLNLHLTCEYVTYRFRYLYHESAASPGQRF